jgi:hypothetical protein
MSERAYQRFLASYMLSPEESLPQNKQEIINYTEDALQAFGKECDDKIDKMSKEELQELLEEVRRLRAKNKKKKKQEAESESEAEKQQVAAEQQTA